MAEIAYTNKQFRPETMAVIGAARRICADYAAQGFDLTLRQLYYQFVSRDLIANTQSEYSRLGSIVNDARMAGYLDWNYIVDRTRNVQHMSHWDTPAEIIAGAAASFARDKWADQGCHVEVWIEKDALVGVLQRCCPGLDVDFFSCRGYTSQSEMWSAAQRLRSHMEKDKMVRIIHLGDHDPSGIDMTRDITERLATFIAHDLDLVEYTDTPDECVAALMYGSYGFDAFDDDPFRVDRIALNMDQVRAYNPPPNPAKVTDSRAGPYIAKHGRSSWELDALEPTVLVDLITRAVERYRDEDLWDAAVTRERDERTVLTATSDRWTEVEKFLGDGG